MRRLVASLFFILSFLVGFTQGNFPVWDKDYAWGGSDNDYLMDIHQNEKNLKITAAGHTYTSNNQDISGFNKGLSDFWVVQVDTGGVIQYENSFGGDSTDNLAAMVPTADDGYLLAGYSASGKNGEKSQDSKGGFDYWIVKINASGNKQWDKTIGGSGDDILTCAIGTGDGSYLLGGYSKSGKSGDKSEFGFGYEDFWLVKVNSSGNVVWDLTLGGDSTDIMKSLALGTKEIIVGGHSISNISGSKSEDSYGGYDFWLNKVDFSGNLVNDTTLGGNEDDFLEEIRTKVHSPGYWVAGTTHSGATGTKTSNARNNGDVWFLRMDREFNVSVDVTVGSNNAELCKDMEVSPEGSVIIASRGSGGGGNKGSGTNGGQDYWIFKADTFGNIFWDRNYGGSDGDSLEAIFIKCDRGILAGGYSASGISGDRSHANKGEVDYWAFELSVPTHPWFRAANVCARTPLNFFDESDVWPDTWLWNFDDPLSANNTSEDQHPIHTYTEPGVYNVSMTIKEGCQNDTTLIRQITVYDNTVLGKVDLGRDFSICGNAPVELINLDPEEPFRVTYKWSTGDSTQSILVDTSGFYSLTISDANCSETDEVQIDTCPDFAIPNAFTPNGDDMNEVFKVVGIGLHEFELMIFNRWGQMIYRSEDQDEGWDGTYKGNPCQIDVYVYKLVYKGLGLSRHEKVGRVALIR